MVARKLAICLFFWPFAAFADFVVKDEGTRQGVANQINCTGSGVTCSVSGSTAVINSTGGAGGSGLPSDPTACESGLYVTDQNASGTLTCAQPAFGQISGSVTDAQVPNTITVDLAAAATVLAANPADCSAGQYATTIAASGALTCAQVATSQLSGTVSIAQGGTTETASTEDAVLVGAGTTDWAAKVLPSCSDATNSKLLYNSTTNTFSCGADQAGGSGGGHNILDEGVTLTTRENLNFVGAGITCTDDSGGGETECEVDDVSASTLEVDCTSCVNLTSEVGGTLPVGNGGTGVTSYTNDQIGVSNGTVLEAKTLPDCDGDATVLHYDQATNAFSCGDDDTGAGAPPTVLVLGGDITATSTALVDLTGMTFSATANKTYKVEIYGIQQSAVNTTGFGYGVNCAQAPQHVYLSGAAQLANAGTTSRWSAIANNAIVGVTSGVPTANTNVPAIGEGFIKAHATLTGNCTFRSRSEVAGNTTTKAGSVIVITQLD
jgi:hypothetical protein